MISEPLEQTMTSDFRLKVQILQSESASCQPSLLYYSITFTKWQQQHKNGATSCWDASCHIQLVEIYIFTATK